MQAACEPAHEDPGDIPPGQPERTDSFTADREGQEGGRTPLPLDSNADCRTASLDGQREILRWTGRTTGSVVIRLRHYRSIGKPSRRATGSEDDFDGWVRQTKGVSPGNDLPGTLSLDQGLSDQRAGSNSWADGLGVRGCGTQWNDTPWWSARGSIQRVRV